MSNRALMILVACTASACSIAACAALGVVPALVMLATVAVVLVARAARDRRHAGQRPKASAPAGPSQTSAEATEAAQAASPATAAVEEEAMEAPAQTPVLARVVLADEVADGLPEDVDAGGADEQGVTDAPEPPALDEDLDARDAEDEGWLDEDADTEDEDLGTGPDITFSWGKVEFGLLSSQRPLTELESVVKDIEDRLDQGRATSAERFFADGVRDTGVLELEEAPKRLRLVELARSDLLYLQGLTAKMPHETHLALLSLEALLNAMRLASEFFDDLSGVSAADLDRFRTRTMRTVLSQAPIIDNADWTYLAMPWQTPFGPAEHGEWSVRHTFSETIESLRLPWRLTARFRANVASGDIAIEFEATPAEALPKRAILENVGTVSQTRQTRMREASRYAASMALLLAACAFVLSAFAGELLNELIQILFSLCPI